MTQKYNLYKENPEDEISWVDNVEEIGEYLFTFDGKKIFNLFRDYPHALSEHEKQIFDQENPFWRDFFKDRQ